jgi:hypothetical protein
MPALPRALGTVAILLSATLGARGLAAQEERNHLYDKWQLTAAGAVVFFGSEMRIDGSKGRGTEIHIEDDLGLASTKFQGRGAVRFRIGHRHELELGYLMARRNQEKTITRDLTFADTTFTAGFHLKSVFNADNAFLAYRYAFIAKERTQVGAALGIGAILFKTSIEAEANVGGATGSYSRERSLTGPTGSLGLFGRFRLGEDWYLESEGRAIWIGIDRFDAYVLDVNGAIRYFPWTKFGFEAGYSYNGVRVDVAQASGKPNSLSGQIKYNFQNVRLGIIYTP